MQRVVQRFSEFHHRHQIDHHQYEFIFHLDKIHQYKYQTLKSPYANSDAQGQGGFLDTENSIQTNYSARFTHTFEAMENSCDSFQGPLLLFTVFIRVSDRLPSSDLDIESDAREPNKRQTSENVVEALCLREFVLSSYGEEGSSLTWL